jgi:hypothetical protein
MDDRDYFDRVISDLEKRLAGQRDDDRRAVDKAEASMNRRLDAMNEIREQLGAQRADFLPRETFDTILEDWRKWRGGIETAIARVKGGLAVLALGVPLATAIIVWLINRGGP